MRCKDMNIHIGKPDPTKCSRHFLIGDEVFNLTDEQNNSKCLINITCENYWLVLWLDRFDRLSRNNGPAMVVYNKKYNKKSADEWHEQLTLFWYYNGIPMKLSHWLSEINMHPSAIEAKFMSCGNQLDKIFMHNLGWDEHYNEISNAVNEHLVTNKMLQEYY